MQAWKTGLLGAAAAFAFGGAAWAQDPPMKEPAEAASEPMAEPEDEGGLDISFNVGVASDYVFRGVSQTDEGAQVFGGVDLGVDNFYAGAWASNVDFSAFGDGDTNAELDVYAGVKPEVGGFTLDFAAIGYFYFNQPEDLSNYDYFEAKAAVSRAFGPATLGGAVYYSPEFFGEVGPAWYYEANGGFTISDRFSVTGAIGRQVLDDIDDADYTTWNVGVTIALTEVFGLDLRYHDTDADDFGDAYEGRAVASLKAAF